MTFQLEPRLSIRLLRSGEFYPAEPQRGRSLGARLYSLRHVLVSLAAALAIPGACAEEWASVTRELKR